MQGSSSLARKRPAETGIEEFEYNVVNGHVDDDVQIAVGPTTAASASEPSGDLDSHMSFLKASLVPQLQRGLEDHFRQQEVDVGAFDLKQMAFDAASMGVVTNGHISTNDKLSSIIAGENGFFASLFVNKQQGETWDIQNPEDLKLLATVQERDDPYLLYGAPPSEVFNALQSRVLGGAAERPAGPKSPPQSRSLGGAAERRRADGVHYLRVAVEAYRRQLARGRFFVHEAPWTCASWETPEVKSLLAQNGVYAVKGDMCKWQLTSDQTAELVTPFVLAHTGWMTNSEVLAELLVGGIGVGHGHEVDRRVRPHGGGLLRAACLPPRLVRAFLKGVRDQLKLNGDLSPLDEYASGMVPEQRDVDMVTDGGYWDDVRGGWLRLDLVEEARHEEMTWLKTMEVYAKVDERIAKAEKAKMLTLRWVDTNKGTEEAPKIRSRLVAREIKARGAVAEPSQLFSAMPPLEALKVLIVGLTTLRKSTRGGELKLAFWDVSRAHFYGHARRRIFARLPDEDYTEGKVALLQRSWYGTQDAASIWQDDYAGLLAENGYVAGKSNPAIFWNRDQDSRILVHGDDFVCLGDAAAVAHLDGVLTGKYACKKMYVIGFEAADDQKAIFLNRSISIDGGTGSVVYEPDERHVQEIIRDMGLATGGKAQAPSGKRRHDELEGILHSADLDPQRATRFRSNVMRAAYLGQDRPDIAEPVKCLTQLMHKPNEDGWCELKKLARYLAARPKARWTYGPQRDMTKLTATVDSDFAGCLRTRKSTTGLITRVGRYVVKTASNLQSTVSLSSGESEYYALVKGAATALGVQALMADWGWPTWISLESDSSAARAFASRRGLGRLRHVQVRFLWLQDRIKAEHLKLQAIAGAANPADVLTKPTSATRLAEVLSGLSFTTLAS